MAPAATGEEALPEGTDGRAVQLSLPAVQVVDPLASIVHRDSAYRVGKALAAKLKELIPRQQFKIPVQASIGARVVASESISGGCCCCTGVEGTHAQPHQSPPLLALERLGGRAVCRFTSVHPVRVCHFFAGWLADLHVNLFAEATALLQPCARTFWPNVTVVM